MRSSNAKDFASHSLVLGQQMIIGNHLHIMNIKSRFKKPITSKTISRMVSSKNPLQANPDESKRISPDLRLSIGRTVQKQPSSILAVYKQDKYSAPRAGDLS